MKPRLCSEGGLNRPIDHRFSCETIKVVISRILQLKCDDIRLFLELIAINQGITLSEHASELETQLMIDFDKKRMFLANKICVVMQFVNVHNNILEC